MADSPECSICKVVLDSWRHSLFDCQMARCVCALADEELTDVILSNRTDDAKLWVHWLVDTLPANDITKVLVTIWAIWWARRRAIHDDQFQSPISTSCFITKFLEDLETAALSSAPKDPVVISRDLHATNLVPTTAAWLPPEHCNVKFNVDGGLSKDGKRGAAAVVCRDEHGLYLGASARVFAGLVDPASLEAYACNEVLALASDLHIQSFCVASDCAEVVANIRKDVPCRYAMILQEIQHQAAQFQETSFIHEKRVHNGEAHALAKADSSLSTGRHLWLSSLPDITCIPMNINT